MAKIKYLIMIILISVAVFTIPNISNASDVNVTKNVYANNGSMKFEFTGLNLDQTHSYEYGLTKAKADQVGTWHLIPEANFTQNTATVDISTITKDLREIINLVDDGYITIKDKTAEKIVLEPYKVDLKIPFLQVTNYTVIKNGKEFGTSREESINISIRNSFNSESYYQYEKITDQKIIDKYKEIKEKNGNMLELQDMLKTTPPTSGWNNWDYWNGNDMNGLGGFGYPQKNISLPDSGLYYMWVYFSGNKIKNIYGYSLVDNLQPTINLESISLPKTEKVAIGKTITLKPTFNPVGATNKIVTWTSSDETVATVDNAGKITPKKLGSTIITVTSQDGSKKATCTVTVVENVGGGSSNSGNSNSGNSNNGTTNIKNYDSTMATGNLPRAGIGIGIIVSIIVLLSASIFGFFKWKNLKDVK